MGLRCSLLGHDFAESEVENERERQGSEVVVTVRELEKCSRCETTRVVSENKEIRSVDQQGDDGDDREQVPGAESNRGNEIDQPDSATGLSDDATGQPDGVERENGTSSAVDATVADAGDDDAVILDAEDDGPVDESPETVDESPETVDDGDVATPEGIDDAESGPTDEDAPVETAPDEDVEFIDAEDDHGEQADERPAGQANERPAERTDEDADESASEPTDQTDDGVILDEEGERDERGHGEWPAVDQDADDEEPSEWPEVDAERDAGFDAGTASDPAATVEHDPDVDGTDAEFIDAEPVAPDVDESDMEWAEADRHERSEDLPEEGTGITSAGSIEAVDQAVARGEVETELVCPECGHTARRNPSSLRPGDICPECARGYISEQAVDR